MSDPLVQFSKVSKRYDNGHEALCQVNFTLDRGEMVFLTGHSGAGKSTLLKLIAMIERPSQGQVFLNGQNLNHLRDRHIPALRRSIGVIFQDPRLLYQRTAFENVALPLHISGCRYQDVKKRVRAALDKVGLLSKEKMLPGALSSGEQQRVGIARAIVHKPMLLIADEPTGNLDPALSMEIMKLFGQFNQVGVGVLVASHDLALIAHLRYRMLTLARGRLHQEDGEKHDQ